MSRPTTSHAVTQRRWLRHPLIVALISTIINDALAHTRLECPPPRSGKTGAKSGPCDAPDDPSLPAYPLVPGALNTVTWLESLPHPGAPGRIALSLDGDDSAGSFESCLLLDHIPHDENSRPSFGRELTYHRSSITLWVPDVYCERCHLQLMTVMSDEIHGVPEGTSCAYGGAIEAGRVRDSSLKACPVVYHSCAPVSINGTVPRNDIDECDTADFEEKLNWPMKPTQGLYEHSTYFYKGDPGEYSSDTSQLMMTGAPLDCPSNQYCNPDEFMEVKTVVPEGAGYVSLEGTCATMVTMEVEPFELGKLPSTPKTGGSVEEEVESATGGYFDQDDPCSPCEIAVPCFSVELCQLRDPMSGEWSGLAAPCNDGAELCEGCFADSPCHGFNSGADNSPATADEVASGEGIGGTVPDTNASTEDEESGAEQATTSESDAGIKIPDIAADLSSEKGQENDYDPDSVSESNPSSSTNAGLLRLCVAAMLIVFCTVL